VLDPKEVVIPNPQRPRRVLEVGCGSVRTLVELADKRWNAHGLEPSAAAVQVLSAHWDFPVSASRSLRLGVRLAATLLAWLKHAGRISFVAS